MSPHSLDIAWYQHVCVVTFAKPPNNHLDLALLRDLADTLLGLDDDPNCRVAILRSAGKIFCAGADLATQADGIEDIEASRTHAQAFYEQAARLFSTRKPIIAAVQGAAIGAGLGLALIADFRIAAAQARFAANFVKLSFHPGFGLTYTLPRLLGHQRASLLFLTGRRISGELAREWGLVDQIVSIEQLLDSALVLAAEIAGNGPLGLEATRATLRQGMVEAVRAATVLEAARQASLRDTRDFGEGILSVHERRPGRFQRR